MAGEFSINPTYLADRIQEFQDPKFGLEPDAAKRFVEGFVELADGKGLTNIADQVLSREEIAKTALSDSARDLWTRVGGSADSFSQFDVGMTMGDGYPTERAMLHFDRPIWLRPLARVISLIPGVNIPGPQG